VQRRGAALPPALTAQATAPASAPTVLSGHLSVVFVATGPAVSTCHLAVNQAQIVRAYRTPSSRNRAGVRRRRIAEHDLAGRSGRSCVESCTMSTATFRRVT